MGVGYYRSYHNQGVIGKVVLANRNKPVVQDLELGKMYLGSRRLPSVEPSQTESQEVSLALVMGVTFTSSYAINGVNLNYPSM